MTHVNARWLHTFCLIPILLGIACDHFGAPKTPTAKVARMERIVRDCREQSAKKLAGFMPPPPSTVDLMTGGDWGAAIDLKQALESGFPPSCRRIRQSTLASLKGMIIHYSRCAGLPVSASVHGLPDPLLPQGFESIQEATRRNLTPERREVLILVTGLFERALSEVQDLGSFDSEDVALNSTNKITVGGNDQAPHAPDPGLKLKQLLGLTEADVKTLVEADPNLDFNGGGLILVTRNVKGIYNYISICYSEAGVPRFDSDLAIPGLWWVWGRRDDGWKSELRKEPNQDKKADLLNREAVRRLDAMENALNALSVWDVQESGTKPPKVDPDLQEWVNAFGRRGLSAAERNFFGKLAKTIRKGRIETRI